MYERTPKVTSSSTLPVRSTGAIFGRRVTTISSAEIRNAAEFSSNSSSKPLPAAISTIASIMLPTVSRS